MNALAGAAVQTILRKLHANIRAEATSRSMRRALGRDPKGTI